MVRRLFLLVIFMLYTLAIIAMDPKQLHAGSETPKTVVEKTEIGLVEVPKTEPQGAGVQSGGDGWPIPEGTVHEP